MIVRPIVWLLAWLWWLLLWLPRRLWKPPRWLVVELDGPLDTLSGPPSIWRFFRPTRPSLQELERVLERAGAHGRVEGVVFIVHRLSLSGAQIDAVRARMQRLRAQGKRVVCWASGYDSAKYRLACAADTILVQVGGSVMPLGVQRNAVFVRDLLARIGVELDVVRSGPHKTAMDMFTRQELSDELREMLEWLTEDAWTRLLDAVADGRGLPGRDEAAALVDASPYTDREAVEARVVDEAIGQEELPGWLAGEGARPAKMGSWRSAARGLTRRPPRWGRKGVAVLRVEGNIVEGRSQQFPVDVPLPFLFATRTGDATFVQQVRDLTDDRRAAAVVLWIDSPGGSATASEAMTQALERLAAKKPLIVVMDAVAASGGYYVATAGSHVIAAPATLTGSIGVVMAKLVDVALTRRLDVARERIERGARIGMFDTGRRFDEAEREILRRHIDRIYEQFVERVARARDLSADEVDAVGRGRVWTGRQALDKKLVDQLGGLWEALAVARRRAGLDDFAPVTESTPSRRYQAPSGDPSAAGTLAFALAAVRALESGPQALCPFWVE